MDLIAVGIHFSHNVPRNFGLVLLGFSTVAAFLAWKAQESRMQAITGLAVLTALTVLFFGLADLVMLAALPRLGLSFGPVTVGLVANTAIRMLVWAAALIALGIYAGRAGLSAGEPNFIRIGLLFLWLPNLLMSSGFFYSLYIEPFDLRTTHIRLESTQIHGDRPLRIVHLSDIHVERITKRERALIEQVKALQPDLILMTGDYLNIDYNFDPIAQRDGREVLSQLDAPYGVYAVRGSPPVDPPQAMEALFGGQAIHLLKNERMDVVVNGTRLYLIGVDVARGRGDEVVLSRLMSEVPKEAYSVLLYHTPDLADAAAESGVDLYLGGHTHGGQIRIPFYGALITMSSYGKRFEAGEYRVGETIMYISRGIGMEGLRLPRFRFLCPPEIVVFDIARP